MEKDRRNLHSIVDDELTHEKLIGCDESLNEIKQNYIIVPNIILLIVHCSLTFFALLKFDIVCMIVYAVHISYFIVRYE